MFSIMMFSFISSIGHTNGGDKISGFLGVDSCIRCFLLILDIGLNILLVFLLFSKTILLHGR